MPLNVRRFNTSVLLVLVSFVTFAGAQTVPSTTAVSTAAVPPAMPTSGDVMRGRISKSKAYIAVRNYNAAIFELENIRKETSDPTVHGVANVLLMNSYLEQGDFKRAQDMLDEFYSAQKASKPNAAASYMTVAGQIVKSARSRADRYKALGLSVSDRTLPLEALNDLEKMRETLEIVITQAKELGKDKARSSDAMAMLEEASGSRSMLARDDYDARRWKDEVADTREIMAGSSSIVSAVNEPIFAAVAQQQLPSQVAVAQNTSSVPTSPAVEKPVVSQTSAVREREVASAANTTSQPAVSQTQTQNSSPAIYVSSAPPTVKEPVKQPEKAQQAKPETAASEPAPDTSASNIAVGGPLEVGSLISFATKQAPPIYPSAAKTVRAMGVVKVDVIVDEKGDVVEVQTASGPMMLQSAAKDAVRRWKFRPFVRDGQPVRATGHVSFNFSL